MSNAAGGAVSLLLVLALLAGGAGAMSESENLAIVQRLVASGADIHADEEAALRYASENGHLSVVEFLVASGADIHADNESALRLAAVRRCAN